MIEFPVLCATGQEVTVIKLYESLSCARSTCLFDDIKVLKIHWDQSTWFQTIFVDTQICVIIFCDVHCTKDLEWLIFEYEVLLVHGIYEI